jgi:Tfp pilus assembly protein FimV
MPEAPYIALDAAARQSRGGTHHGALVDTVRALIDAVSASDAPEDVTRAAMAHISRPPPHSSRTVCHAATPPPGTGPICPAREDPLR